jgi:hypothetical protein
MQRHSPEGNEMIFINIQQKKIVAENKKCRLM